MAVQQRAEQGAKQRAQNGQKRPRPPSLAWLERAALHYLGRFSSSEAHLRTVLRRKLIRRLDPGTAPSLEHEGWIESVTAKCRALGYVDDQAYARMRANGLLARGKPVRVIRADLRQKGIEAGLIADVIRDLEASDPFDGESVNLDLRAAVAYARRRRFGAYQVQGLAAPKPFEKQLAAMARAGFAYDLAKRVLTAEDPESLSSD